MNGQSNKERKKNMKLRILTRKRTFIFGILLIIAAAIIYFVFASARNGAAHYALVTLTTGNVESTISSTGTLSPVTQVEVGTQVSGTLDKVLVDFNQKVKKGQIIAVVDTSLLRSSVIDAQSGYLRADAQMEEAQINYTRSTELLKKGMLSESEFQTVKTSFKTAQASLISAQSALERAQQNLKYAIIRSPIDGTVTARNVEAGQTVAASFSTPTLFTIAQDLSKMEIKALVDESDIGEIKEGLAVRFTVQAYPAKKFEGLVKQVRVLPTTTANVVNYTVVISAENKENLLLPGMTATVEFIVVSRMNVLLAPNAAFRFQPAEAEMQEAGQRMQRTMGPPPDSMRNRSAQSPPMGQPPNGADSGSMKKSDDMKMLWYIDKDGLLAMAPVRVGITDGTNTEIVESPVFKTGMQVISGNETAAKSSAKSASKSQSGPPGPPPF
jgi:HlyD family secretion protein